MDDQQIQCKSETVSQVKKSRFNLGDYCVNGGPGRPSGSKNKFTIIKEQLAEVWEENNGKGKFKEMFNEDFAKAIDKIIAVMPKEKDESSTTNNFNLTIVKFENNERNQNPSSRVSGIDTPMAT